MTCGLLNAYLQFQNFCHIKVMNLFITSPPPFCKNFNGPCYKEWVEWHWWAGKFCRLNFSCLGSSILACLVGRVFLCRVNVWHIQFQHGLSTSSKYLQENFHQRSLQLSFLLSFFLPSFLGNFESRLHGWMEEILLPLFAHQLLFKTHFSSIYIIKDLPYTC